MTPVQAVIAKELRIYLVSPIVYVVGAVFLLIFGLLSYLYVGFAGAQAIQLMHYTDAQTLMKLDALFKRQPERTGFVPVTRIEVR